MIFDRPKHKDMRHQYPKGEKHPSAKLTSEDVIEIRQEIEEGTKYAYLGYKYGVSTQTIGKIAKRQKWAHI